MCSCNEEYYIPLIRKEERARPWRTPYPLFIEDVPRRNRAAAGEHGAVRARLLLSSGSFGRRAVRGEHTMEAIEYD